MVVSFGSAQGRLTGESRKVGIKSGYRQDLYPDRVNNPIGIPFFK